jgi:flagellar motility protein MotE (MotC chaperone)
MTNVLELLKSLKYLFLKKLSTGSDEAHHHQQQILGLNKLIKTKERNVEQKRIELTELKAKRQRDNELKRKEIRRLKEHLSNVEKLKKNKLEMMKQKNLDQRTANEKIHREKVSSF